MYLRAEALLYTKVTYTFIITIIIMNVLIAVQLLAL